MSHVVAGMGRSAACSRSSHLWKVTRFRTVGHVRTCNVHWQLLSADGMPSVPTWCLRGPKVNVRRMVARSWRLGVVLFLCLAVHVAGDARRCQSSRRGKCGRWSWRAILICHSLTAGRRYVCEFDKPIVWYGPCCLGMSKLFLPLVGTFVSDIRWDVVDARVPDDTRHGYATMSR